MMGAFLDSIGLVAPGLEGWPAGRSVLAGERAYVPGALPPFSTTLLPPNERRRITPSIKLALQAAQEAVTHCSLPAHRLSSVFVSAAGDGEIIDRICTVLTLPDRPVSPIHFHNSVHNAAAGYWAIATGSMFPSVSLSAQDESFAAGLLEASAMVLADSDPVLLVAHDHPCPPPLDACCPLQAPFAVGLLLSPARSKGSVAELVLHRDRTGEIDRMADASLEALRDGNPAARSLPLLQALARGGRKRVTLPHLPRRCLTVEVVPC
jgi:hypothetical protein